MASFDQIAKSKGVGVIGGTKGPKKSQKKKKNVKSRKRPWFNEDEEEIEDNNHNKQPNVIKKQPVVAVEPKKEKSYKKIDVISMTDLERLEKITSLGVRSKVYIELIKLADEGVLSMSLGEIARHLNIGVRQVNRILTDLQKKEAIILIESYSNTRARSFQLLI